MKKALITLFLVLIIDQVLKIWIKLNFQYEDSMLLINNLIEFKFIENPGMAFGLDFGGPYGKLVLSVIRLIAVFVIGRYLIKLVRTGAHGGFIICVSMILAGAIGNILDSAFYGLIFDQGLLWDDTIGDWNKMPYIRGGLAEMEEGYAPFLMGHVVDMFHFLPKFPDNAPWGLAGRDIFAPVFNVADAAISIGVIVIILFQKRFFPKSKDTPDLEENESVPA
ncbi:MAG: lipoprotein signal peptidase [Bacteroidota bacterium]